MPIYEFLCKACRKEFKTLRPADRLKDVTCPTCGDHKVNRLLSITAHTNSGGNGNDACALPVGGGCCGMNPNGCCKN